jgi:REase_AHJR-like
MNTTFAEHEKIAKQVGKELESYGYSVMFTPSSEHIPFSLEGYTPDLLATKHGEHLIIEIKPRSSAEHAARFRKIIDIVEKHPGWKFLIKTISDIPDDQTRDAGELIGIDAIESYVQKADRIVETGSPELSIPYFWNALISVLRLRASRESVPFVELTDRSLINHLYTMGLISSDDYEKLKEWNHLRNEVVHSVTFQVDPASIEELSHFTRNLIRATRNATLADEQDGLDEPNPTSESKPK